MFRQTDGIYKNYFREKNVHWAFIHAKCALGFYPCKMCIGLLSMQNVHWAFIHAKMCIGLLSMQNVHWAFIHAKCALGFYPCKMCIGLLSMQNAGINIFPCKMCVIDDERTFKCKWPKTIIS